MIIQILSNLCEEGYLQREEYTPLFPFFAGANVAFRKHAIIAAGLYDTKCLSGEDQDMCLRIAQSGWGLYFEPKATVRHKSTMALRTLVRKWFYHGFHHSYIFNKHCPKGIKIYRFRKRHNDPELYSTVLDIKFPLGVHIFFTPFITMHLLLLAAVVLAIANVWVPVLWVPALMFGVLAVIRAFFYFKPDLNKKSIVKTIMFIGTRYLINLALIVGGFLGGIRLRMLFINATLDYAA